MAWKAHTSTGGEIRLSNGQVSAAGDKPKTGSINWDFGNLRCAASDLNRASEDVLRLVSAYAVSPLHALTVVSRGWRRPIGSLIFIGQEIKRERLSCN